MIRVVLVDDQELIRFGLGSLLERDPEITVVAEAEEGRQGLSVVAREVPDVVLMDIRMPGVDGLEATRRIVADPKLADVRVVVLTTFDEDELVLGAIRAGAAGFLLKDTSPDDLRRAVHLVADGDALLSPGVTRRVMQEVAQAPSTDPGAIAHLTEREREVLTHVGQGMSNDEVAGALFISPATARTYVSRLLTKLDARDRAQVVAVAWRSGLVTADS